MTMRSRRTTETGTGVHDPARRRALFGAPAAEQPTPTVIEPGPPTEPIEQATPTEIAARPERSEPIRVISMKDRAAPRAEDARVPLHVQLRSMAEVAGLQDSASRLGHLAPPRDPRQARKRRQRDNVVWACVAIALACVISLGIWLIAGH